MLDADRCWLDAWLNAGSMQARCRLDAGSMPRGQGSEHHMRDAARIRQQRSRQYARRSPPPPPRPASANTARLHAALSHLRPPHPASSHPWPYLAPPHLPEPLRPLAPRPPVLAPSPRPTLRAGCRGGSNERLRQRPQQPLIDSSDGTNGSEKAIPKSRVTWGGAGWKAVRGGGGGGCTLPFGTV